MGTATAKPSIPVILVISAWYVGLVGLFRNIDDWAAQDLDQSVYRLRFVGADVEALADDIGLGSRAEGLGHVAYVDEVAALRAVTHDRVRLAGETLVEEHAEHCSIDAVVRTRGP